MVKNRYEKGKTDNPYTATLNKILPVRFGGAQIPITQDIPTNFAKLKQAIDWAKENEVEYLVTPEGSLSGYWYSFAESEENIATLNDYLHRLIDYSTSKRVGLCLGTLFREDEKWGKVQRNQLRFYDPWGHFCGVYNKIRTIASDAVCPGMDYSEAGGEHPSFQLRSQKFPQGYFEVSALICNDFYGEDQNGQTIARRALYSLKNRLGGNPVTLVIHPTYGFRGKEVDEDLDAEILETFELWHENHVKQLSYSASIDVLTVDTISDFCGEVPPHNTSSPTGFVSNGKTIKSVPRQGEHYFYHDINMTFVGGDSPEAGLNDDVLEHLLANNPLPDKE